MVYGVWCIGVWCMVYGVTVYVVTLYGARQMVNDVIMCDVWCIVHMYGVMV